MEYFWRKRSHVYLICAFFVVFIHNTTLAQYADLGLANFSWVEFLHNFMAYGLGQIAVPMFFLLSGFCFFRNYDNSKYASKLSSRAKTLLIPFLIWNTFALVLNAVVSWIPALVEISHRELFELTPRNVLEGIFLYKYNYHFWFMFNLIIYVATSPLIYAAIKHKWVGLATIIGALLLSELFPNLLTFSKFDVHFTVFYLLGSWLSLHYRSDFIAKHKRKYIWIARASVVLCVIFKTYALYANSSTAPIWLHVNLAILCLAAWIAFVPTTRKNVLDKYAQYAFPLYIVHPFVIPFVVKLLFFLLPKNTIFAACNYILAFLATVVISYVVIWALYRVLPNFAAVIFGSKDSRRR